MRPVCDLHDCSQTKIPFENRTPLLIQDVVDWWFGLLSYAYVLHTFQRENTYAKLHENAPFKIKNYKNFLAVYPAQTCPHRGYSLPEPPPPPLGVFGASTLVPSMGNCHGCPQILETPLQHTQTAVLVSFFIARQRSNADARY